MAAVPKKIQLAAEGNTLAILWSDGHRSVYSYQFLRDRCPCATCTGAQHGPRLAAQPPSPFVMFTKALKPERAERVGRYAVQIHWSDGHSTGIYSFDYLRELCPCPECTAPKAGAS